MTPRLALLFVILPLGACETDPCAGHRDLAGSPAGLELVAEEHPAGWGDPGCFQCHVVATLHQDACSSFTGVSMEAVRAVADPDDTTSCIPCHGTNGVPEWEDTGA